MKPEFVHLHNHSEYSLLDGTTRFVDDHGAPSEFLKWIAEQKMPALAFTDHGNMYGALEFYLAASKVGVRPIIGVEAYIARGSRLDRETSRRDNSHLTLLAKDEDGYRNLMKLVSAGFLEGFYYDPRIDKELLAKHAKGLIALSGCLKGEVGKALTDGDLDGAGKLAAEYSEILGPGNYYLEFMDHGLDKQRRMNEGLLEIAKKSGLPVVATNDCHYFKPDDWEAHDARVCISTGKLLADPPEKRLRFESHEFYFKTAEEMAERFKHLPEAIKNTLEIADKCRLKIATDQILLPHYPVPGDHTVDSYLELLCRKGLAKKLKAGAEYESRLKFELEIIRKMGFSGYFLIVWDFIHHARSQGIPVGPGRGSGAGSLVAYALDITKVDPLEHRLLFERFLNPDRKSMPDLDIDFSDAGRERVIDYVRNKYGAGNVAQIITFGTMAARLVVRDVGRVLGLPLPEVDRLAKLIPAGPGQTLHKAMKEAPELSDAQKRDPQVKKLFEIALKLEGLKRHTGVHAAGTIITKEPVVNYVPLAKGSNSEVVTTGFDDVHVLKLGLLKVDFLGLRNLTVIDHAVRFIHEHTPGFDVDKLPAQDDKAFELLQKAKTFGVFQLESHGMRDLLWKLKPTTFEDISAVLALYRPGPMQAGMLDDFVARKHGHKKVVYDHPLMEEILKDTYGCIVFQEQVMEIAKRLAGFTPGEADGLRKAMGKKIQEEMEKARGQFVSGCAKNKISDKLANKIFDNIVTFGGYGFNKCVVGDTRVPDARTGRIWTVRELLESGEMIEVWSLTDDRKCAARPVADVRSNGVKPVFKLRTSLGKEIRVTDNHPFHTFQGWKELRELKAGDRIAVPRSIPSTDARRWPRHESALLGWVLSEGNTRHPAGFYVYSTNEEQARDMIRSAEAFENTSTTLRRRRGLFEIYVRASDTGDGRIVKGQAPWNKGLNKGSFAARKSEPKVSEARKWLDRLGIAGCSATKKFIPAEVFELAKEDLAVFVGRLWSGDGFIGSDGNMRPFYATSSPRMARDLQALLLRFGIVSRIASKSFKYRGGTRSGFAVYIMGRESTKAFIAEIGPQLIGREEALSRLAARVEEAHDDRMSKDTVPIGARALIQKERVAAGMSWKDIEARAGLCVSEMYRTGGLKKGFRRGTLRAVAEALGSKDLKQWAESDVYWDTVASIEADGEEETFDLEVPGTHNFLADGIFVHNSHTVAYATVSWQTAYLKAHYPLEFMTALLTSEIGRSAIGVEDKENKVATYLTEAKAMGLPVRPPDVNRSVAQFSVERDGKDSKGGAIRFGLEAVKNVGHGVVEAIVEARRAGGPFASLDDFCRRVDLRQANKKVLESLVKAGAMDALAPEEAAVSRATMLASLEQVMESQARLKEDLRVGQGMLFGSADLAPAATASSNGGPKRLSEHELLQFEKEVLGFYFSGHPLTRLKDRLDALATHPLAALPKTAETVRVAGMLTSVKRMITKEKKEPWARATLEDLSGEVPLLAFPKKYAELGERLKTGEIVVVMGRTSFRGEGEAQEAEIICEEVLPLDQALARWTVGLTVRLSTAGLEEQELEALRATFEKHRGSCRVALSVDTPGHGAAVIETDEKVRLSPQLFEELEKVLGEPAYSFKTRAVEQPPPRSFR